jgi:hypothetical protein
MACVNGQSASGEDNVPGTSTFSVDEGQFGLANPLPRATFSQLCASNLRRRRTMPRVRQTRNRSSKPWIKAALLASMVMVCVSAERRAQAQSTPSAPTPDATQAPAPAPSVPPPATQQPAPQNTPQAPASSPTQPAAQTPEQNLPDAPKPAQTSGQTSGRTSAPAKEFDCTAKPCQVPIVNWYMRFENGPQVKPLTPQEKGWLATKNVIDPFNIITILGEAGISVAADSHSAYGPGFMGWQKYVGVSFTEDITGEFFGTFLIPSIAHQDPHYHRMPHASYKRRIFHAIDQIVWTEGDNGKGMLNYADLIGAGIDDEIANLYVPGRETNGAATAQRYGIALATAPIGNFITEFLPDVASHIHVQVVIVQRIINQVANKESSGT